MSRALPLVVLLSLGCASQATRCLDSADCAALGGVCHEGFCTLEETTSRIDAGEADAGEEDAGRLDAGLDGGPITPDGGRLDGGTPDAGRDAGLPDAGPADAGLPDAGFRCDGGNFRTIPVEAPGSNVGTGLALAGTNVWLAMIGPNVSSPAAELRWFNGSGFQRLKGLTQADGGECPGPAVGAWGTAGIPAMYATASGGLWVLDRVAERCSPMFASARTTAALTGGREGTKIRWAMVGDGGATRGDLNGGGVFSYDVPAVLRGSAFRPGTETLTLAGAVGAPVRQTFLADETNETIVFAPGFAAVDGELHDVGYAGASFGVAAGTRVYLFNGSTWSLQTQTPPFVIRSVAVIAPGEFYAAGDGQGLARWKNGSWYSLSSSNGTFTRVSGSSACEVWVTGSRDTLTNLR